MRIGLTYDLKVDYLAKGYTEEETAELDSEDTIKAIEEVLMREGYEVELIGGISNLVLNLAAGKKWDLIFNIAEGLEGFSREARIPALLEAYDILYTFSDPLTLTMCLHKGIAKKIVKESGILTPKFEIIEDINDIENITFDPPYFLKPVAEGTGKGINSTSIINDKEELVPVINNLLMRYKQPVLLEEMLSGREFTVGVIGTGKKARVLGVMEIHVNKQRSFEGYSYFTKQNYSEIVKYSKVDKEVYNKCCKVAISSWKALGGRDGGRIDIIFDENNRANFIEANPLAGLHPTDSDLPILAKLHGIDYHQLISLIVKSALERKENI